MFLGRMVFKLIRTAVRLGLACVFLGAIGLVLYTSFWLPDVALLSDRNPETTAFIERTKLRLKKKGELAKFRQTWVPLDKVSPKLVNAVRIAEDDRFYLHNGFDFTEIWNAVEENWEAGRFARGGSTLSQQVSKNLYLVPDKTLSRKVDETLLTWKIEQNLTKDRILEIYLNVASWGYGCFGVEEAAKFYFSKRASQLTAREAADLASRLPNPEFLASPAGAKQREARERVIYKRLAKQKSVPGKKGKTKTVSPRKTEPKPKDTPALWTRLAEMSEPVQETLRGFFFESETVEIEKTEPAKPVTRKKPKKPERSLFPAPPPRNPEPPAVKSSVAPAPRIVAAAPQRAPQPVSETSPAPAKKRSLLLEKLARMENVLNRDGGTED